MAFFRFILKIIFRTSTNVTLPEADDMLDDSVNQESQDEIEEVHPPLQQNSATPKRAVPDYDALSPSSTAPRKSKVAKKLKENTVEAEILALLKQEYTENCSDMCFLKGLLPYFKQMDMSTKLDVQFQFMSILRNLSPSTQGQSQNVENHSPQTENSLDFPKIYMNL